MNSDEWSKLPRRIKKKAIKDAYSILRKRASEQIEYLKKSFKVHDKKDIRHDFMLTMVLDFWEDVDFIFYLANKPWQKKSEYVARAALEKVAKLSYLTKKQKSEQMRIARMEMLKVLKGYYDNADDRDPIKKSSMEVYLDLMEDGDPEITENKNKLDSLGFIGAKKMLKDFDSSDSKIILGLYSDLCYSTHGNFFNSILKSRDSEIIIRVSQLAIACSINMLLICDHHINNTTQKNTTEKAIENAKSKAFPTN